MWVESSYPVMGNLLLALGLCLASWLQAAWAAGTSDSAGGQRTPHWCVINPVDTYRGKAVEVEHQKVHIVRASQQANAIAQLTTVAFKQLSEPDALTLLRDGETVNPKSRLYLVRASAFYVDANYDLKSRLEVYLIPVARLLKVINTSLSQPGTMPVNLAILAETETEITEVSVMCQTAA